MGAVISLMLSVFALLACGVLSSIAASKSHDCPDAEKYNIISAVVAFLTAIIAFLIAVFFL